MPRYLLCGITCEVFPSTLCCLLRPTNLRPLSPPATPVVPKGTIAPIASTRSPCHSARFIPSSQTVHLRRLHGRPQVSGLGRTLQFLIPRACCFEVLCTPQQQEKWQKLKKQLTTKHWMCAGACQYRCLQVSE